MKNYISLIAAAIALAAPSASFAAAPLWKAQLQPTPGVVDAVLGAAADPSSVVMPRAVRPSVGSVGYYDNMNEDVVGKSITNAVLDRSIRPKVVRAYMDLMDPGSYSNAERIDSMRRNWMRKSYAYTQEHCQKRFAAQKLPYAVRECGEGKRGI